VATNFKNLALKAHTPLASKLVAQQNVAQLQATVLRFNTIAQAAYDKSVLWQRLGIAGTITEKFAKATLKEVAMNAVSTFGPGAFVDGAFGGISKGEGLSDINSSWSNSNLTSKGWDYTFGANGGHFQLGDSGMTRLSENAIKSSIGWGIGLVQDALADKAIDAASTGDAERVDAYIDANIPVTNPIQGARKAMKGLPVLSSADAAVQSSVAAHQAKNRSGTQDLIKEATHQIDQLCYALNDLSEMAQATTTFRGNGQYFRKCREMAEFMGKMYWFRRKYNKTRHFLDKLRDDYITLGLILSDMESFWRENIREFEMLAMRAAAMDSSLAGSSGGSRTHLMTDLNDHGGTGGDGGITSGSRNWRSVT
jgi:hypothetical protein